MRIIKFRAWYSRAMYDVYQIDMTPLVEGSDNLIEGVQVRVDKEWVWLDAHDIILMQYTGLKDKNGVEIYEGDVVRFSEHFFGDSFEKECVMAIGWDEKECGYHWKLTHTEFYDGPNWCEIIGNIYENPELLK